MTSRGGSRDLESQEEDRELQDDLTIIVRILQVASEEAKMHIQLGIPVRLVPDNLLGEKSQNQG